MSLILFLKLFFNKYLSKVGDKNHSLSIISCLSPKHSSAFTEVLGRKYQYFVFTSHFFLMGNIMICMIVVLEKNHCIYKVKSFCGMILTTGDIHSSLLLMVDKCACFYRCVCTRSAYAWMVQFSLRGKSMKLILTSTPDCVL